MQVTLTWGSIGVFTGAILGLISLAVIVRKIINWIDSQDELKKKLPNKLEEIKNDYDNKIAEFRKDHEKDILDLNAEQAIIIIGILAALKGLKEQGCNGPVTEAIDLIEDHINRRAHDVDNNLTSN